MRADNENVEYFYDLLSYEIEDARAKAGDENYLAFLCNARTLFCKVYDFLNSEDDLKKVKKRIDKVKEQLAKGYDVFGNQKQCSRSLPTAHKRKIKKSKNRKISKSGVAEELPEVELENLLMQADWQFKNKSFSNALTNYLIAAKLATGTFANLKYDGTTTKNAAIMGLTKINPKFQISNFSFQTDSSFRSAELILQLYQKATNDEQCANYDTETAITALPKAHPLTMSILITENLDLFNKYEYDKFDVGFKDYRNRKAEISTIIAEPMIAIYVNNCKFHEASKVLNHTIKQSNKPIDKYMSYDLSQKLWWWLPNDTHLNLYKTRQTFLLSILLLKQNKMMPENLMKKIARELLNESNNFNNKEEEIKELVSNNNFSGAKKNVKEITGLNSAGLYNFILAKIAIKNNNTNETIKILTKVKEEYKELRKLLKLNEITDNEIINRFTTLEYQIPDKILQQIIK